MKKINFTKMHGIGNDYIYVNCFAETVENPNKLAILMSPRRFSVGADGLVLIGPSKIADAKMSMFNADGSEGKMCGNAIRCVGKYIYDNKISKNTELTIETLSGIKAVSLIVDDGIAVGAKVDMGLANIDPKSLPVLFDRPLIDEEVDVSGKSYRITAVSMGNPHAVIFTEGVDDLDLEKIGPDFENMPIFPERVNTEFVEIIDRNTLKMRVWERGSGETYACGTGACAAVSAAVLNGHCGHDSAVTVKLKGGELKIVCRKDMRVFMTGPAAKVYQGVYEYED